MLPNTYAFVDTETTGYHPGKDRIIEIAIIRVENGKIVDEFKSLINPNAYVSPFIQNYTNISPDELEFAPEFYEIADRVEEILRDAVFVAHNVNFDLSHIRAEFRRIDRQFSNPYFCTVRLSRILYPKMGKHNLSRVIEYFGFDCENRHRAYDDAYVLHQFVNHAKKDLGEDAVNDAILKCIENSNIPYDLDESTISDLPECPGVYIFYDKNSNPLYVGKSKNIKKRVKSHLYDKDSSKELRIKRQINDIKAIPTAGEISALILESDLVKELMPIYNHKLRRKTEMVLLKQVENEKGYLTATYERVKSIKINKGEKLLGIFSSIKECKENLDFISAENNLCNKLLGTEKAITSCFRYHLGRCNGACVNKEDPAEYNKRFADAFKKSAIEDWPFDSSIEIQEQNENGQSTFVVDKWCLVNDGKMNKFDYDIYKIIRSAISNTNSVLKVRF